MKVNKTILLGAICIFIAGVIFATDMLNPIIRPITYLFLMGSSKGKDIIFFGLVGLFLILSQVIEREMDSTKYLKISIVIGVVLLALGILLEIIFRLQMGIGLNTVFCSMSNTMSSTSILHTHLLKAILGGVLVNVIGPFIQSDINTGVGLYSYLPSASFLVVLLLPILFAALVLAIQKRNWVTRILLAFFSSCLLIGAIDGGLWGTPALVGILGLYLVYRNGYYLTLIVARILKDDELLEENESVQPPYRNIGLSEARYYFNRFGIYLLVVFIVLLRFTVAFAGAEPDYYTVEIANPADNIDLSNFSTEIINYENNTGKNTIIYHIDPSYNEMELINDLKIPLKGKCDYYTVTWNAYSYLE